MHKLGKMRIRQITLYDVVTTLAILIGLLALVVLVYFNVKPIKFADIKVPISTDKSVYYPRQTVSGIFFGETFYDGNVKILREVFCTNYQGIIKPPAEAADGDFFSTIAKPRQFNGDTIPIGNLPDTVPIGQNCIIRFTNVYQIQTPFGIRHGEYKYYTQNFSIISKEQYYQTECKKTVQMSSECLSDISSNTTTTIGNNVITPSEPVTIPQTCGINFLGIKLLCQ